MIRYHGIRYDFIFIRTIEYNILVSCGVATRVTGITTTRLD